MSRSKTKNAVTVRGAWFAMPLDFLRSRACAQLSPHAVKMLIDLCAQLGPNAKGNGDLSAAPANMRPRGWSSDASRRAALCELEAAHLVTITRRGNRRSCTLYAVSLWPLQCDLTKLEVRPGCFATNDWSKSGDDKPTEAAPVSWNQPRKNAISAPVAGQPPRLMSPQRDNPRPIESPFEPAAGLQPPFLPLEVGPSGDTYLDFHLHGTNSHTQPMHQRHGTTVALSSAGDATITADALKFATSTIGGKLIATASTGSITLSSANVLNGKTSARHSRMALILRRSRPATRPPAYYTARALRLGA